MKKLISFLAFSTLSIAYVSAQYVDDLYVPTKEKDKVQKSQQEYKSQQKQAAQQRRAEYQEQERRYWEQQSQYQDDQDQYANGRYKEYVDDVKDAYQRRQDALTSSSTNSAAYWKSMEDYYNYLESKYDQELYNIIVLNDKIWVEPKYITSVFDGDDPNEHISGYKNRLAKSFIQNQRYSSNNSGGYNSMNLSFNVGISPYYNGFYNPWSWNSGWGWGNSYWGGGFYPGWSSPGFYPGWGGYYPYYPGWGYPGFYPGWGGGYWPPIVVVRDSRPTYHGNSVYGNRPIGSRPYGNQGGGSSVRPGSRPGGGTNYVPGMGLGTGNRPNNGTTRPTITTKPRPEYKPNNQYDYRNNQPTRNEPSYSRPSTPSSSPSYSPPSSTNSGGGRRR